MSDPYIYTQLNTKKLSNVTAEEIMNITDPTHIEFENEFDLERYNLINKALFRDGLSMPNKGNMVIADQTVNDTPIVIRPPLGEVWRVQALSATNLATLSGNQNYYLFLSNEDDGSVPQTNTDLFLSSLTSSATALTAENFFDDNAFLTLEITNKMFLRVYGDFGGTSGAHTLKWFYAYTQLR